MCAFFLLFSYNFEHISLSCFISKEKRGKQEAASYLDAAWVKVGHVNTRMGLKYFKPVRRCFGFQYVSTILFIACLLEVTFESRRSYCCNHMT